MEKRVLGFLLFSIVVLSGIISAETFMVTDSCDAGDDGVTTKRVMGLSDPENAHGELEGDSMSYGYYLCSVGNVGFGSTTCDGENKVIGLSDATNAHGEIPELDNYGSDVCFDRLRCVNMSEVDDGGCYDGYPFTVLSLSSETNAHIGNSTNYDQKVCCYALGTAVAYWADEDNNGQEIATLNAVPGITQVELRFEDTSLAEEKDVDFIVREVSSGNEVGSKPSVTFNTTTKRASKVWTIPGDEDWVEGEEIDLQFEADVEGVVMTSEILTITILDPSLCEGDDGVAACSQYIIINYCSDDPCEIADDEIPDTEADCSSDLVNCFCFWNSTAEPDDPACQPRWSTSTSTGPGSPPGIKCDMIYEDGDPDVNDEGGEACDNGFIEYFYHTSCDETRKKNSIDCPSQVELPFFGFYNFVVTMLVIALIYYFVSIREKKKSK